MPDKKKFQYPGEICRPEERIIDRVEVELFRSPYVPEVDLSAVEDLATLLRPMKAPPAPRAAPPPEEVTPVLVQELKDIHYKNLPVDVTVAHVDLELGLRDMGIIANTMTVIRRGAPAAIPIDYKINSRENDPTPVMQDGQQETEFEIEELYITNGAAPPGTPTMLVRVNWTPFLTRIRP